MLLGLSRLQSRSGGELEEKILAMQDVGRASLEDVRRIAIELRLEALDDLGLPSALAVLVERLSERLGLRGSLAIAADPPTNVARHSGARDAEMSLSPVTRAAV